MLPRGTGTRGPATAPDPLRGAGSDPAGAPAGRRPDRSRRARPSAPAAATSPTRRGSPVGRRQPAQAGQSATTGPHACRSRAGAERPARVRARRPRRRRRPAAAPSRARSTAATRVAGQRLRTARTPRRRAPARVAGSPSATSSDDTVSPARSAPVPVASSVTAAGQPAPQPADRPALVVGRQERVVGVDRHAAQCACAPSGAGSAEQAAHQQHDRGRAADHSTATGCARRRAGAAQRPGRQRARPAAPGRAAARRTGRAPTSGRRVPRPTRLTSPPRQKYAAMLARITGAGLVLVDDRHRRPADRGGRAGDAADEPGGAERCRGHRHPHRAPGQQHGDQHHDADHDAQQRGRTTTPRRARPTAVPGTRPPTAQDSPRQSASRHSRASVANG